MKSVMQRYGQVIQIVLGVLVTTAAAADMVGRPARAVGVITVGAGMLGAGIGLGRLIEGRRARALARGAAPRADGDLDD